MAYNLDERFKSTKDCFRLLDPGAYNLRKSSLKPFKTNKYPFHSNTPRDTFWGKPYTEAIYDTATPSKIPNVTVLKSKVPRFPYQLPDAVEEIQELLCRCGLPCDCPVDLEPEQPVEICQAHVKKTLFKGPPPRAGDSVAISVPTTHDRGFDVLPDGSLKRLLFLPKEECPPFYDAAVHYSTDFYHGWKWSKWTSQRRPKSLEVRPGPADYTTDIKLCPYDKCAAAVRARNSKNAKVYRYSESVINRTIRDNFPGPADYNAYFPAKTEMQHLGPKAERFLYSKYDIRPDPATYKIKRSFDLPDQCGKICFAELPEPACFGTKAKRFQYRERKLPGPADYDTNVKIGKFQHCSTAPFGVSSKRFKDANHFSSDEEYLDDHDDEEEKEKNKCPNLTWQFRSKTTRFRRRNVLDPGLHCGPTVHKVRSQYLQYRAPFSSSEGRFQPWHDWLAANTELDTPGAAYYNTETYRCLPAVKSGPLCRARRFPITLYPNPAPNAYTVGGGISTTLNTHNQRLKNNIENQIKHKWTPPPAPVYLTPKQKELLLLDKAIKQCEVEVDSPLYIPEEEMDDADLDDGDKKFDDEKEKEIEQKKPKKKLLRSFLYTKRLPIYF